jgi:hypothetical protein
VDYSALEWDIFHHSMPQVLHAVVRDVI